MFASDGSYKQGESTQQSFMHNLPPLRSLDLQAPTPFSGEQMHTEAFSHSTTHPYSEARYNVPEHYNIRSPYMPNHPATYDHRPPEHQTAAELPQPIHLHYPNHSQQAQDRRPNDLSNLLNNLDPALAPEVFLPKATETPTSETSEPPTLRKGSLKEKARIDVLDDGGSRPRAFVACRGCRTRKIKCDGARPTCNNCAKRAKADEECTYDAVPRRRGPDKQKGGRQRMTKEAKQRIMQAPEASPTGSS
ncbi:hypothetical protein CPB83DRAFT_844299 [Crepidotus variabilis]|uniref:Zn(2)-C6 fungal-type domain-containing protein n=1 Tax=Crepidotus variabilis TaxID=179855 RepID=A0A9P6ESK4_9AGAR|nr:hypothetical protein CPB83DRAFT_844299 [Crepidotus variabilis]